MRSILLSVLIVTAACRRDGGYGDPDDQDDDAVVRIQNESDARLVLVHNGNWHNTRATWTVDCGPHTPDLLMLKKTGGELVIAGTDKTLEQACNVEIVGRDVKEITISGNGDLEIEGPISDLVYLEVSGNGIADLDGVHTPELDLVLGGNGDVTLTDLQADHLTAALHGNGDVTLGGDVDVDATITSSGNGTVMARDLRLHDLFVDLGGSSETTVTVEHVIGGEVTGSAFLEIFGEPDGNVSVSGSGEVEWR